MKMHCPPRMAIAILKDKIKDLEKNSSTSVLYRDFTQANKDALSCDIEVILEIEKKARIDEEFLVEVEV